jgi:hypothetical protein
VKFLGHTIVLAENTYHSNHYLNILQIYATKNTKRTNRATIFIKLNIIHYLIFVFTQTLHKFACNRHMTLAN